MKYLKWLKPSTYHYEGKHTKEMIDNDAKVSGALCLVLSIVMFLIYLYVLIHPEHRYDSGMDNVPKLIGSMIGGMIGFLLSVIPIKSEKLWMWERNILKYYLSGLFMLIAGYEFLYSDAKADAIFVYLIYCVTVAVIMHMNPIYYLLQTIFVLIISAKEISAYFNSIGTMFSFIALLLGISFLVFYANLRVRFQLSQKDKIAEHREQLERELREKTEQVVISMRRQTAIQENVILAIADLVENRDTDTGTHIKATAYYVKVIAKNALKLNYYTDQLNEDFIHLIEKAAPMHDLGKIMIPDAVLKVPRRLTTEEFEIMKQHATEGARIIRHVYAGIETPEYITCAANIAHYHHEKWNGSGYPEGISGQDIPLEARIMAIADVFDALVSKRCYKDAYPLSEAFTEIEKGAGSHFDPYLVEAFLLSRKRIEDMILNDFQ